MIDRAQVNQLLDSDVVDARGEKIGAVRQVWLDDRTGQPLWAEVHTGLFGMRDNFVPIQDARLGDGQVVVPVEKKQVKDSPQISVHDGHMSDEQQEELYSYYGIIPTASTGDHDRMAGGRQGRGRMDATGPGRTDPRGRTDTPQGRTDAAGRSRPDTAGRGRADMPAHGRTDAAQARGTAQSRDAAQGMTRHEEQLHAGVREVEAGRVRLVKHVVTEQAQITVPVEHEEVRVVREPADGTTKPDRAAFTEEEAEITLRRQEPVVEKTVHPVEHVRLDKETVTDQQKVTGEIRKERIEVEEDNTQRKNR